MALKVEGLGVEASPRSTASEGRVLCPMDHVLGLFLYTLCQRIPLWILYGTRDMRMKSPRHTFELNRGIMIP
jgi:hypothetical protein